jgi:outer membrane protein assembly factor BamB
MKKSLLYIFASLGLCAGISSCVPEEIINDTDVARHQITDLTCAADDEEVTLTWSVPEGWEPTDYLITYNDAAAVAQRVLTEGKQQCTITGLQNDFEYTFNVQAVYGKAISNMVGVKGKPVTSRIPAKSLAFTTAPATVKDQYVELTWEKPSDRVLNYTLTYYPEMNDQNVVTRTLEADVTPYRIEGITNEDNYVIQLVANYPKGEAPAAEAKVYFKIAYFVSRTYGAIGQILDFTFNMEEYPGATDIKWTFPGNEVLEGENVSWRINSSGTKNVILSATVNGKQITWPPIELELRKMIIEAKEFVQNGTNYNGFKGSYPVFSPDGKTIYDITFNKTTALYAYDLASGTEKWRYQPSLNQSSYNPLTVNPVTGDIYFGTTTAGHFYCITPEGALKWEYTGAGNMQSTSPAVSADGNIVYIIDKVGKCVAINAADGSEKWNVTLAGAGAQMLINGNILIVAIQNTAPAVYFLDTLTGAEVAPQISVSNKPTDISGMAISDDKKTAYMPLQGGGMASIDLATNTIKTTNIFATNNVYAPVVASNGFVVAGSKDGCVYALSADLSKVEWTFVHGGAKKNNVFNYSHMCADDQGRVFVTSGIDQNLVYVFNAADGTVISSERYGSNDAYKQMGGNNFVDGFLFSAFIGAGSVNGALIGEYMGGNRKFWGGPGGDICGSCCIQSPLL